MMLKFSIMLIFVINLTIIQAIAATLNDINITNSAGKATVTLGFNRRPVIRSVLLLHNPERLIVDLYNSNQMHRLYLKFGNDNLIKRIRSSIPVNKSYLRLVFELTSKIITHTTTRHIGNKYNLVLTITRQKKVSINSVLRTGIVIPPLKVLLHSKDIENTVTKLVKVVKNPNKFAVQKSIKKVHNQLVVSNYKPIVVAIDAGHGGQDPGAIGINGLNEKKVNINIARKLKSILYTDTMFKPVLTRDSDCFIAVNGRANIARKKNANVLVSIHADAAPNSKANGASVWVISNRRANSEMANWLEQHEKQSELLDGASDLLANNKNDLYLKQAVLDLQFRYSQRVGYEIAVKVLNKLQQVILLHKHLPEYASLGVLRSPDIPSLLVETGFISNAREERLLSSSAYQHKIAQALYLGLRAYFLTHPLQQNFSKIENNAQLVDYTENMVANKNKMIILSNNVRTSMQDRSIYHIVKDNETLFSIARQYGVSISVLQKLNNLKKNRLLVGQQIRILRHSDI